LNNVLGRERDSFDRAVRFHYGLLTRAVRGCSGYSLPLDLTMSTPMTFELFGWMAAELFGGDPG